MCVIVYKPPFTSIPSKNTLRLCDIANPDGAGFVTTAGATELHLEKGFNSPEALYNALRDTVGYVNPALIHFRLATSGNICPEFCQPYPLSHSNKRLMATSTHCTYAVAHNGHVDEGKDGYPDTYLLIRDKLYSMHRADLADSKLVSKRTGLDFSWHRLAIMRYDGEVILHGNFEKHIDGCFYSNLHWLQAPEFSTTPVAERCIYCDSPIDAPGFSYLGEPCCTECMQYFLSSVIDELEEIE